MHRVSRSALFLIVVTGAVAHAEPSKEAKAFGTFRAPTADAPQSIGAYGSGCVLGAASLPLEGPGWKVARPERRRFFGHPDLIDFVRDLGAALAKVDLPSLNVGDLGQARGGPAVTGHASHQSGLDADFYFLPPQGDETVSVVDRAEKRASSKFTPAMVVTLRMAALDPHVERIFIDPVLKRSLCERTEGDRSWLRKLNPWWGHDDHFHVRLACPPSSPACVGQRAPGPGDGCSELAWWFDDKAQAERTKEHKRYAGRIGAAPELPAVCRALIAPVLESPSGSSRHTGR